MLNLILKHIQLVYFETILYVLNNLSMYVGYRFYYLSFCLTEITLYRSKIVIVK